MQIIEIVLITLYLIGITFIKLMTTPLISNDTLHLTATLISIATLFGLIFYYLFRTEARIYKIALIGLSAYSIGTFLMIFHLPGAGTLRTLSIITYLYIAVLFIRTYLLKRNEIHQVSYNLLISILITLQVALIIYNLFQGIQLFDIYDSIINYVLTGLILSLKIKGIIVNKAEDKILTIILLFSVGDVISGVLNLIL